MISKEKPHTFEVLWKPEVECSRAWPWAGSFLIPKQLLTSSNFTVRSPVSILNKRSFAEDFPTFHFTLVHCFLVTFYWFLLKFSQTHAAPLSVDDCLCCVCVSSNAQHMLCALWLSMNLLMWVQLKCQLSGGFKDTLRETSIWVPCSISHVPGTVLPRGTCPENACWRTDPTIAIIFDQCFHIFRKSCFCWQPPVNIQAFLQKWLLCRWFLPKLMPTASSCLFDISKLDLS